MMKKSLGPKTIVFPTPVFIVGTYDKEGRANAMNVAWGGICCSSPPCVAISLRRATYTYGNIVENKAFTVNIPTENFIKEADYFGIVSGKKVDKFAKAKLTPKKGEYVYAPYVEEFPLCLECKLHSTLEIGLHTLFIGEILDVKAEKDILDQEEVCRIEKVKPLIFSPTDIAYYGLGQHLGQAFSIGKEIA